ncbi:MAG: hypothetical protein Q9207_008057 [Kuettlingeria erythrocarpa]
MAKANAVQTDDLLILRSEHFIYRFPRGPLYTEDPNSDLIRLRRCVSSSNLDKITREIHSVSHSLLQRVGFTKSYAMDLGEVDIWRQEVGKVIWKVMYLSAELDDIVRL